MLMTKLLLHIWLVLIVISIKATKELNEVLADYYAGQTITNSPTAVDSGLAYFSLVVATENYSINLNFSLKGV